MAIVSAQLAASFSDEVYRVRNIYELTTILFSRKEFSEHKNHKVVVKGEVERD